MARKHEDYAIQRRAGMGEEGKAALDVFRTSYSVGSVVLDARKRMGLTQRQVASAAGVAQADISRIERGVTVPTIPTFTHILGVLDAHVEVRVGNDTRTLRVA